MKGGTASFNSTFILQPSTLSHSTRRGNRRRRFARKRADSDAREHVTARRFESPATHQRKPKRSRGKEGWATAQLCRKGATPKPGNQGACPARPPPTPAMTAVVPVPMPSTDAPPAARAAKPGTSAQSKANVKALATRAGFREKRAVPSPMAPLFYRIAPPLWVGAKAGSCGGSQPPQGVLPQRYIRSSRALIGKPRWAR